MKKYISSGLALSAILALTGCGSSDDLTTTATTTGTGYYVDSAVSGVNYLCGDQNGTTDAEGMFKFAVGKDCTFKLGNIVLKTIASDNLVDQATVVENNVSVAAFLQTVDVDGNASNGIQITTTAVEAVKTALEGETVVPTSDKLDSVYTALKNDVADYNGTVVSETDAANHLATTQESVTKELLAGQTYYVVHISGTEHFVGKVSFNADVTSETWTGLINDSDSETESVTLDGNKLVWSSDNSYSEVIGENAAGYILAADYNEDGTSDGTSYLFVSQSEAEAFYNAKYPPAPTASDLSFDTLKGQNLVDIWDSGYEIDSFDGSNFTFNEYNASNSLINTDVASVAVSSDPKTATFTFDQGSVYTITLNSIEDVSSYNGVDVSSYGIKKISETHTCVEAGTPKFQPSGWTPTYWDGNETQPITDIATFVNQFVADDTGWWTGHDDGQKYMFAAHEAVSEGEAANGDIVVADANGTYDNCDSEDCTKYVRSDNVVGTWSLDADGVLVEDVPNEYGEEVKFVDGQMQEADVDIVGKSETDYWYTGLTSELIEELMD
jgi:hypothetical protein